MSSFAIVVRATEYIPKGDVTPIVIVSKEKILFSIAKRLCKAEHGAQYVDRYMTCTGLRYKEVRDVGRQPIR